MRGRRTQEAKNRAGLSLSTKGSTQGVSGSVHGRPQDPICVSQKGEQLLCSLHHLCLDPRKSPKTPGTMTHADSPSYLRD